MDGAVPVVLQGSVVDPGQAQWALDDGVADLVEMTRAQIADPDLVTRCRSGEAERVRPCVLCNQACMVRDTRNPVVTCVVEPRSGHELDDADTAGADQPRHSVLVVGGGPAGMEAARVLALRGHLVRLAERGPALGGMLASAALVHGRQRLAWRLTGGSGNCGAWTWRYRWGMRSPRPSWTTRWPAESAWCWPRDRFPARVSTTSPPVRTWWRPPTWSAW